LHISEEQKNKYEIKISFSTVVSVRREGKDFQKEIISLEEYSTLASGSSMDVLRYFGFCQCGQWAF
jgi:hypothetical protein